MTCQFCHATNGDETGDETLCPQCEKLLWDAEEDARLEA